MWGASTRAQKGGPGTVNSDRCLLGALLRVVVAVKPSVDETGWKVVESGEPPALDAGGGLDVGGCC